MKEDKKPDLVVFNEETNSYDASLKPYGTSASSPVIKPLNTATWKNDGIQRVNTRSWAMVSRSTGSKTAVLMVDQLSAGEAVS